jgi:IS5 family transposase
MEFSMIGAQKNQVSILDGAFNRRQKRARSDALLDEINHFVDWQPLVQTCQKLYKDSKRGRPTIPIEFSLKCLFLQYLYGLSDPALEDALIDRFSFQRFLGISFETEIPDFSTIWRFRERLVKAKLLDDIFAAILTHLDSKGLILRRGTLIDASIVQAARRPRKKHTDDDVEGPRARQDIRTYAQQEKAATHTKKGKKSYYGYKGHIGVDQGSNIIRRRCFTTASVHDSQPMDALICEDERSVFADKAYPDDERKRAFRTRGIYYGILDKGRRNRPLSNTQKKRNKKKSRVRNAVERPFAHFKHLYGYRRVRYVTLARNDVHFTFLCMIYNVRRWIALSCV